MSLESPLNVPNQSQPRRSRKAAPTTRLAPESPHPMPVEDCYAGLTYLADHAASLGVDPKRIAVMGESAGGGLATAIALLARDRNGPAPAKQILIYAMLDDRNTKPDPRLAPFASWTYDDNITGWRGLLGARCGKAGTAAEFERLRGLGYEPDGCFVDLGETAETVVASRLRAKEYGCVIIGAGVRANPKYFLLFEKLLNLVHELAPKARIAFNTKPTDTVEAVRRWL
jgi:acetyl esterase/lipase